MAIYESIGFGSELNLFDKIPPFEYIERFKVRKVPDGVSIADYKRNSAPYCLSGEVKKDENGLYKRNNASLLYRDLIFLDYDDIEPSIDFPNVVFSALKDYSYIIYPTINHTVKTPRYRLVLKPRNAMNEQTYKQTVQAIAQKIGLPFDSTSLTWSQLQGLPVTTGDPEEYQKIINKGIDYPVSIDSVQRLPKQKSISKGNQKTITMRVLNTLLHGFGDKGGRNVAVTRFVGLLLSKWVDADIATAYEVTKVANTMTDEPLSDSELDRTFESIVNAEIRKRGINGY